MPTLFISDLHLCASQPKITENFFYFLEHIAIKADALYILGDFFEYYVGDDDNSPFLQSIIAVLAKASDQGLPIFLMRGNRDFLMNKRFAKRAHVTLLRDPTVITLYQQRTLLMHGDSLCTLDRAHQRFRKLTNNRLARKLFLWLPLSLRQKIGNHFRWVSETRHKLQSSESMDVYEKTVLQKMKKYRTPRLIHGHTHQPAIHALPEGKERIVLAAWHDRGNYLRVSAAGNAALVYFDSKTR